MKWPERWLVARQRQNGNGMMETSVCHWSALPQRPHRSLIFVAWWSGLQCRKLQNRPTPVSRLTLPCPSLPPSTHHCKSSVMQSLLSGVGGTQTGELGWDRLCGGTWSVVGLQHALAAWIQTTGLRWVGTYSCSVQTDPTAASWELESAGLSHQCVLLRWWKQAGLERSSYQ